MSNQIVSASPGWSVVQAASDTQLVEHPIIAWQLDTVFRHRPRPITMQGLWTTLAAAHPFNPADRDDARWWAVKMPNGNYRVLGGEPELTGGEGMAARYLNERSQAGGREAGR